MAQSETGYSGTPLARKLGIKAGMRLCALNAPSGYNALLCPLPEGLEWQDRPTVKTEWLHQFFDERAALRKALKQYRAKLKPDAVLWVSWPKKSSGVATDITEDVIREEALPLGWVDVKVCAVDGTWSGLKLVVRKELR